jgi:hypothetical protein
MKAGSPVLYTLSSCVGWAMLKTCGTILGSLELTCRNRDLEMVSFVLISNKVITCMAMRPVNVNVDTECAADGRAIY